MEQVMSRLQGQRIVITGGTTGIGYAAAERVISEGASVIITGQDRARIEGAATRLGPSASALEVDQAGLDDIPALEAAVRARFGTIDTLFLNAGVTVPAPTEAEGPDTFDRQMTINLKAPFFIMKALAPLMKDGGSVILNTSCLAQLGMPGMAVYSATKAALRSLARTWAAEYVGRGIRVNAIAPGPVETPIYGKLGLDAASLQGMAAQIQAKVPMNRFGKPHDIAGAVAFLASADSAFMTGEEITIDGGWTQL
jgi:NAD(P)-dependent dehydrogenase (short-subunit alcohol dehydrogenase family)